MVMGMAALTAQGFGFWPGEPSVLRCGRPLVPADDSNQDG